MIAAATGIRIDCEEAHAETGIARLVRSGHLDSLVAGLLALNFLVIAIETQFSGLDAEYELYGYRGTRAIQHFHLVFTCLDILFALLYTCEMFVKMLVLGTRCVTKKAELVDVAVVIITDVNIILGWFFAVDGVDATVLIVIRLMRLFRLVRLARFAALSE